MLSTPGYDLVAKNGAPLYGVFITLAGPVYVNATKIDGGCTVHVPQGINGQSYVV